MIRNKKMITNCQKVFFFHFSLAVIYWSFVIPFVIIKGTVLFVHPFVTNVRPFLKKCTCKCFVREIPNLEKKLSFKKHPNIIIVSNVKHLDTFKTKGVDHHAFLVFKFIHLPPKCSNIKHLFKYKTFYI